MNAREIALCLTEYLIEKGERLKKMKKTGLIPDGI